MGLVAVNVPLKRDLSASGAYSTLPSVKGDVEAAHKTVDMACYNYLTIVGDECLLDCWGAESTLVLPGAWRR